MRRPHWLRENRGTDLPNCAAWVDTETREKRLTPGLVSHHLNFGIAWFSRTRALDDWLNPISYRFTKASQFWHWLESRLRPHVRLYLFAHNWSFDAPVLHIFSELPARGWKLTKAIIESPPVILRWRREDQTILCLDTLNWWRMKLADIGESLGLEKLPFPSKRASRETWDRYCSRDVEIIYRVMRQWWLFLREHDLGSFGPTLASQAIRAYRHRFMRHRIMIDGNVRALTLARDSLHGGRVECFRIGKIKGPIAVYDVNSMYPFVMRDNLYPSKLILSTQSASLSDLRRWLKDYCVIARVRIKTERNRFAHVLNERLIFPVGNFIEPLTTPDLIDALTHHEVDSVLEVSVYKADPIFKSFVEEIYALRKKALERSDKVRSWLLKILLNSLYGKFAQRGTVWTNFSATEDSSIKTWEIFDYETGSLKRFRQFAGQIQSLSRETEAFDSHPAIAAHVTAYARKYLFALCEVAGWANVLYADTDSLFVQPLPTTTLHDNARQTDLGALKLEATHKWIVLRGPKDYLTPEKEVIKGIRATAARTDENTFRQDQWSSIGSLISLGNLDAPRTKQIVKVLARSYSKGTVSRDGHVLPFRLNEW